MLTDYTTMTAELAKAAVDEAIDEGEALIESIVDAEGDRTYANTMAPLDQAITAVNDGYGVGGYMSQVHPDEDIRKAGSEAEETMEKWMAGLAFRGDLYAAVKAYSATDEAAALEGESQRNLERLLRDFRRAGQELDQEDRDAVEALKKRIIE
ncbi:MAG: hypothetical protein OES13_09485, partial [Acidimicrobiia bacterium]|nr:hypothetical protein [Acidimicrobiia bacterium]